MTLSVLIERQYGGHLKAWVLQENQKGVQLLSGKQKDVDTAKMLITNRLQKDDPECKIRWTVRNAEDPRNAPGPELVK